jgi:hypothetical protein
MLPHVLVFYANKKFFSLLKKAEQHLTGIYLMAPFATRTKWFGGTVLSKLLG